MKNLKIAAILCVALLAGSAFAQKARPVKFSSVYTNLDRDCRTIRGTDGQDDASDCRGIGGYRVYIYSAAAAMFITVRTARGDEPVSIVTQDFDFDQNKVKVEWRLANGKPFAVIMRVARYADPTEEGTYFGKKIGEDLVVSGLKGFDEINFKIDARAPNANALARQAADKAYFQHGKP
jgi:hypothetical protein